MNHSKVYNQIVTRAKTRVTNEYTERHHILPRSLGGSDDKDNLVDLTPREHLIAHMLLVRMHKGTPAYYSMLQALVFMCSPGTMTKGELKSSWQYDRLRSEVAEMTRQRNLRRVQEGTNPFAGEKGSELAKARAAKMEAEGRGMNFYISSEDRSRNTKAYWSSMTPEERKARAQRNADNRSQEFRAEIAEKSAAKRKENDEKIDQDRRNRMIRINLFSPEVIEESRKKLVKSSSDGAAVEFTGPEGLRKLKTDIDNCSNDIGNDGLFKVVIKSALAVLRLTQKDLGTVVGASQGSIGGWLKGFHIPHEPRRKHVLGQISLEIMMLESAKS